MVDGRFELIESLGSGGMGTVWRALDVVLQRHVALKEVRTAEQDSTPAAVQRERVLREAQALARIGHPNVVAVHHIVDSPAEAHPWIVMELVDGGSLSDVLAGGIIPVERAATLGRGILAGLRAAHAAGVLHRDIKPANVLLRKDDSPVLTDFGIATMTGLTGLTSTGSVVGSLDYVAPERLNGREGLQASDLWSLGLLLFAAVEGYQPMRRDSQVATLAAVLQGEVPTPRNAGALTPVLQALLTPDPDRRPSAEQLDQLLAQVISPGTAVPPGTGAASATTVLSNFPPTGTGFPSVPATGTGFPSVPSGFPSGPTPAPGFPSGPTGYPSGPNPAAGYPSGPSPAAGTTGGAAFPPYSYSAAPGTGPQDGIPLPAPGSHIAMPPPIGPRTPASRVPWLVVPLLVLVAAIAVPIVLASRHSTPKASTSTGGPGTSIIAPPPGVPVTGAPPTRGGTPAQPAGDLLTPDGTRKAIQAIEQKAGNNQFTSLTIYPEYLIANVVLKNRPNVYDEYTYRNGSVTQSDGSKVDSNNPLVAPDTINWDLITPMLATATEKLQVPKITSRYIVIDPDFYFVNDDQPEMSVYISGDHGTGGYVAFNMDGSVAKVYAG
ncbi:serine/threonine protein kinase [Nocardia stercoris]|uniref:non-specific serine/threonine protein kinase n=2 Tax=Nocardia stercoris TaxID=2483361 RepID=A0A3M2LBR3_9NOCA|nr:serine/threonine protein kinase [Nocardia stercoris]